MKTQYPLFRTQLRKHRPIFVKAGFVLFLEACLIPIIPLPLRWLVDAVLPQMNSLSTTPNQTWTVDWLRSLEPFSALSFVAAISLMLGLVHVVLYFFEERFTSVAVQSMVSSTRGTLFAATFSRRLNFIESQRKVDLLSRLSSDVQNYEAILASGLVVFVRSLPTLLVLCITMVWIEWQLALFVFGLLPAVYFASQWLSRRMKYWEREFREDTNKLDQEILQGLQALAILKSLRAESSLLKQLSTGQARLNRSFLKVRLFFGFFASNLMLSRYLIRTVIIALGGYLTIQGRISLGTLFVFASYLELMNQPIAEISNFVSRYAKTLASMDRIEDFYSRLQEQEEPSGSKELSSADLAEGLLQVHNLSHHYDPKAPAVFNEWQTSLPNRGLVALVGESGVGKSTFIKFLNRLLDPTGGCLKLGGHPLEELRTSWLRDRVVVISQDPFFLAQSIRENLLLGVDGEECDEAKIRDALAKAQLTEVIDQLPDGLETRMGEGGVAFSGGQHKRFHIARAFLRESARIVVFDEPSSGLDPKTANSLISELQQLAATGKLVLFSTHRTEDLASSDQVLFFQKGQTPLLSSHHDLLATSSTYGEFLKAADHH